MTAYFVFKQEDPNQTIREFVFAVEDDGMADEARRIISDPGRIHMSVSGKIIPEPVWYNREWSFHLDPSSISFFEYSAEVCDANVLWVEENLKEIGGSALPGMFWCPWSSCLDREVYPDPEC